MSQFGQDRWIIQDVYPEKTDGYFVEAGASSGIGLSNTWKLEQLGWSGICIEPGRQYAELVENRQCSISDACLYDRSGVVVEFKEDSKSAHFNGIVDHLGRHRNRSGTLHEKTTTTLWEVLDEFGAPEFIEYLSLDTEGSEFVILRDFPFARYRFGAITVEHNEEDTKRRQLLELLEANEYRRVKSSGRDDFYLCEAPR